MLDHISNPHILTNIFFLNTKQIKLSSKLKNFTVGVNILSRGFYLAMHVALVKLYHLHLHSILYFKNLQFYSLK